MPFQKSNQIPIKIPTKNFVSKPYQTPINALSKKLLIQNHVKILSNRIESPPPIRPPGGRVQKSYQFPITIPIDILSMSYQFLIKIYATKRTHILVKNQEPFSVEKIKTHHLVQKAQSSLGESSPG